MNRWLPHCIAKTQLRHVLNISLALLLVSMVAMFSFAGTAGASPVPQGGYTQSCRDIYVGGTSLFANCRNLSQIYVFTQLDHFDACVGDISNNNGQLLCSFGQPPAGGYQASCTDIRIDSDNNLQALCTRRNGERWTTSLPLAGCHQNISNIDGHLNCDANNVPAGSYLLTCIDVHADGKKLDAICSTSGGESGRRSVLADYPSCSIGGGQIINSEGTLTCWRGDGDGCPWGNPQGTPGCGVQVGRQSLVPALKEKSATVLPAEEPKK